MDYARFLEDHLPVVDRVVRTIAARGRLSHADAADFRSQALLHLIADDYRVLRAFEGRSTLTTYLTVVLKRLWQDRCARQWSRWRPSAEARRLGPLAVHIERLVQRDGLALGEAIAAMQSLPGADAAALRAIWRQLPSREKRLMVSDDALAGVAAALVSPSDDLQRRSVAVQISRALRAALRSLPLEDRLLLRLRFVDGVSMADISRMLGIRQMQVYPRFVKLLRALRASLEAQGIDAAGAEFAIGADIVRSS